MKETLVFLLAPRADTCISSPPLRVRSYPRVHPPSVMCRTHFPADSAQSCGSSRRCCLGPQRCLMAGPGSLLRQHGEGTRRGSAAPSLRAAPRPPPLPPGRAEPRPHPAPRLPPAPAPSRAGSRGDGGAAPGSGRRLRGPPSPCGCCRSLSAALCWGCSGFSRVRPPEPAAPPERSSRGVQHLCMCFIGTSVVFDGAQAKPASTSLCSLNIFSRGLACKRVKCSRQSKLTIAG